MSKVLFFCGSSFFFLDSSHQSDKGDCFYFCSLSLVSSFYANKKTWLCLFFFFFSTSTQTIYHFNMYSYISWESAIRALMSLFHCFPSLLKATCRIFLFFFLGNFYVQSDLKVYLKGQFSFVNVTCSNCCWSSFGKVTRVATTAL